MYKHVIARPHFSLFFFFLAVRRGERTGRPAGSCEHPTGDLRRAEAVFRRPPGLPCFVPGLIPPPPRLPNN